MFPFVDQHFVDVLKSGYQIPAVVIDQQRNLRPGVLLSQGRQSGSGENQTKLKCLNLRFLSVSLVNSLRCRNPARLQMIGPKRHPRGEWRQRRCGETANGRHGETAKRRCDDQKPLTRWGEELGAPSSSPHRVRGFGHRVPPSPIRRFAYSPQSSVSLYSLGNML